jgi:hypothetical protein
MSHKGRSTEGVGADTGIMPELLLEAVTMRLVGAGAPCIMRVETPRAPDLLKLEHGRRTKDTCHTL